MSIIGQQTNHCLIRAKKLVIIYATELSSFNVNQKIIDVIFDWSLINVRWRLNVELNRYWNIILSQTFIRLYLVVSRRSLVAISIEVYQPAKGAAGNWSPPASSIIPATIGSAYHSSFRSSIFLRLKFLTQSLRRWLKLKIVAFLWQNSTVGAFLD